MAAETSFDYYYGDESNQFSFYRIPRQLVTGDRFKRLSTDAKLLYGLLLDRMGLSAKNGWYDEQGRVYIYYTLDEIQEDLNCGHDKATRMLVELDNGKNGFGLIERVRQGQGRPTKIYVKRFTTRTIPPPPPEPSPRPRLFSGQDCGEVAAKTAEKPQSRVRGSRSQDCGKAAPSYIKSNQTDFSYTDPSILPSGFPPGAGWMDRLDQRREVDEAISYESLCSQFNREDVDEIAELIVDVLCTTRPTLRIGGEELPIAQVKDRFYKLDSGHLPYRLRRNPLREQRMAEKGIVTKGLRCDCFLMLRRYEDKIGFIECKVPVPVFCRCGKSPETHVITLSRHLSRRDNCQHVMKQA